MILRKLALILGISTALSAAFFGGLVNPGFEEPLPPNWLTAVFAPGSTVERSQEAARTGLWSLKFSGPSLIAAQKIDSPANGKWWYGAYVHCESPGTLFWLALSVDDSVVEERIVPCNEGFYLHVDSYVLSGMADTIAIGLVAGSGSQSGVWYADDVWLSRSRPPLGF